jgi:hypothetical protein
VNGDTFALRVKTALSNEDPIFGTVDTSPTLCRGSLDAKRISEGEGEGE